MKFTPGYLLFVSVVTFQLVNIYVSTVTSNPSHSEEVPSTRMPHILSDAMVITVVEGQNVTFQCNVDELGEFVITWLKNTEVCFAHTYKVKKDERFKLLPDKSLYIENVHIDDAANYVCQISSHPILELHHTLNVEVAPAVRTIPESGSLTVQLGEPIIIGCDTSGDPPPTITWTHSMKEVTEYVQDGGIFIPEAKKEHAGVYECKVDKGESVPSLGKIEVNVHYAPIVEATTKLIYTGEGASAKISCDVFGEPVPKLTWLKNKTKMTFPQDHLQTQTQSHPTVGHTHTILIRKVTQSDLANYTCKAENRLGYASETIEITGVPAPVEFKNGVNDIKPDSYAMRWSVKSHSPVNGFQLKFRKRSDNGEETEWTEVYIPAEKHRGLLQTHTYDITGLEPASVYEAVILTNNKYGWNNRSEVFIFSTEGAVFTPKESNENMIKTTDPVTSSSITEAQLNANDNNKAETLYWTTYMVTAVLLVTTFFW